MRKIPVIIPYFSEEEGLAVNEVLLTGWAAQGPKVAEFERVIASHEGMKYGVATTSCTTALHLAMMASGLKENMDVLVPAFTFVASANSVMQAGACPVFVDVDPTTFTIDCVRLEATILEKYQRDAGKWMNKETGNLLWGILPVHQFGLYADLQVLYRIANQYCLEVIEDAACALGAGIRGFIQKNRTICLSFHPRKTITTGEGGMVLCDDEGKVAMMRTLRSHGSSLSSDARHAARGFLLPSFVAAGYNYRMTDVQAAIGVVQAQKLDYILQMRFQKAKNYDSLVAQAVPEFLTPVIPNGYVHTYQSYVCMLSMEKIGIHDIELAGLFRNELLSRLETIGIATRQGTHAVHLLDFYKNKFQFVAEDFPNAYACDRLSITLPLYVQMSDNDQEYVVKAIRAQLDEIYRGISH